ncbi:MAG: LacI family DNA-binding transcriptional regulator, partial [Verrucomicrobiota bacterium]
MKVTVQSVAERAQVSVGTVSRVLNHDPSVSPGLSSRVQQTIEDLGYKPLRKRKSRAEGERLAGKVLGLVTIGMDRSLSRLPVVTEAMDGIVKAAARAEAGIQIIDVPDPASDPAWLKRSRFDGWLIKGAMQGKLWDATHPELRAAFERRPCVWFHGRPRSAPGCGVGVNDWEVGAIAATQFAEAGHKEVAFLSPKSDHALLKRRQHGFVSQCDELGLGCQVVSRNLQSWTFPLEKAKSLEAVDSLLGRLLEGSKNQPT